MELSILLKKIMNFLELDNIDDMQNKILEKVLENNDDFYVEILRLFEDLNNNLAQELVQENEILNEDFMQKIFQYYFADREGKKQDYTPKSLSRLVSLLAGEEENVIDMCAGSGSLTIQKWNINHNHKFLLYEFDINVIPILIFNMAIRNIDALVCHADVLQMEVFKSWKISKGERFGIVKECDIDEHINF